MDSLNPSTLRRMPNVSGIDPNKVYLLRDLALAFGISVNAAGRMFPHSVRKIIGERAYVRLSDVWDSLTEDPTAPKGDPFRGLKLSPHADLWRTAFPVVSYPEAIRLLGLRRGTLLYALIKHGELKRFEADGREYVVVRSLRRFAESRGFGDPEESTPVVGLTSEQIGACQTVDGVPT